LEFRGADGQTGQTGRPDRAVIHSVTPQISLAATLGCCTVKPIHHHIPSLPLTTTIPLGWWVAVRSFLFYYSGYGYHSLHWRMQTITQQFALGFGITPWLGQQHRDTPTPHSWPHSHSISLQLDGAHYLLLAAGEDPGEPNPTHSDVRLSRNSLCSPGCVSNPAVWISQHLWGGGKVPLTPASDPHSHAD